MSEAWDYKVQIDKPAPTTRCLCSNCTWSGPFSKLEPIEHAVLTPGDPSPAGRCPECDCLAYVNANNREHNNETD